ncbi:hypothetical protein M7I_3170 [Glarea lozoyensis 74030]|uniref:Uncharacterized protein n=1 Tax=Glarea lozoyensis (strain ATCC 74030 / MF5533) TaxID=1104152 RepID=H0EKT9_GLAL7|nr:hypothetical protein M7I_3170 [Glarea lozoyensis 74030]
MLDLQESPDTRQADEVVQPSSKGTTTLSATMGTSKDRNHQRPSFLAALNSSLKEGTEQFVDLEDIRPEPFSLF